MTPEAKLQHQIQQYVQWLANSQLALSEANATVAGVQAELAELKAERATSEPIPTATA